MAPEDGQRLGQRFANEFIKGVGFDEIFYAQDDGKALEMIRLYLGELQYLPDMPMRVVREKR